MLAELQRLFEAGQEDAYAAQIRGIIAGGAAAQNEWLVSGDFWGGMGSMIDCAFCGSSVLGYDVDRRNRQEFMKLIVKLGKHQLACGIVTENIKAHIRGWTEIFEERLKSDTV